MLHEQYTQKLTMFHLMTRVTQNLKNKKAHQLGIVSVAIIISETGNHKETRHCCN